jgi:hypothetical protein
MTTFDSLSVNKGHILDLWFEVEQSRELTQVSPDTTASYTEDDKAGIRSTTLATGEQVTLSPIVSYSPSGEPISFNFSSDNPTEIDVSPIGNVVFQVEPESTASANITITATSGNASCSRVYSVTLTLSGADVVEVIEEGVAGSARKALSDPLDNALIGADPATQQSLYTTQDHDGANYVRNSNFLIQGTHAEALTCVSPWNSRQAQRRSGTAITPRHVVLATHYPLYVGDSIRFVASDNTVVARTVVQADDVLYDGNNADARLLLLDSDLPSSITPCKLFPSNYKTYLPAGNITHAAQALPLLATDQQEKGVILSLFREAEEFKSMRWSTPSLTNRLNFFEPIIVGDSGNPLFTVIGSELWLLSTFYGAAAGPFYGRLAPELNAKIIELDTLQGVNTGYTVTEGDLSVYTAY